MNATQIHAATAVFAAQYSAMKEVPFNPKWAFGGGYFDGAAMGDEAPLLKAGETVRSQCTKGRKIIIVGTPLGNIVAFQRYTDSDHVYAANTTDAMYRKSGYQLSGALNVDNLEYIFGYRVDAQNVLPNIGQRLQAVIDELAEDIEEFEQEKQYW